MATNKKTTITITPIKKGQWQLNFNGNAKPMSAHRFVQLMGWENYVSKSELLLDSSFYLSLGGASVDYASAFGRTYTQGGEYSSYYITTVIFKKKSFRTAMIDTARRFTMPASVSRPSSSRAS